jgi:hypothetical protein
LADEAAEDLRNNGDDAVTEDGDWTFFDQLPRMTWKQDAVWRLQMVRTLDDLMADLATGQEPRPRCVGEAVDLDQMISAAEGLVPDAQDVLGRGWAAVAHACPGEAGDEPWETLRDLLFEDRDFGMLFDPALDGVEDDEVIRDRLGMDLRGHIWFRLYPWAQPRDPLRGFRTLPPPSR